MKKLVFPIILSLLIFLITAPAISETRGIKVIKDLSHRSGKLGAYRALIIGINDYKDPKIPDLETAVKDAKAMAELLQERYGFKVNLLLNQNATREVIYRALRKLAIPPVARAGQVRVFPEDTPKQVQEFLGRKGEKDKEEENQ